MLLTSSHSASSDRILAKITDFGVSCVTIFSSHVKGTAVDNPIWKAPEILLGKAYSAKVDVYRLAFSHALSCS